MQTRTILLTAGVLIAIAAEASHAHVDINWPPMRNGDQKEGPCENEAAKTPVTLRSGSTLTIRVTETIQHPGHFRILFDEDTTNGEDFPVHQSCNEVLSPEQLPIDTIVLKDLVLPAPGKHCAEVAPLPPPREPIGNAEYDIDVTLPDIECDDCAIQVVQVMTDKGTKWSNKGGSGLYFRCADIRLSDTDVVDEDPGTNSPEHHEDEDTLPTNGNAGGCSLGPPSSLTLVILTFGMFLVTIVRRKRITRNVDTTPSNSLD